MQIGVLSHFSHGLRVRLLRECERRSELEVQLLRSQAGHLQELVAREEAVAQLLLAAGADSARGLEDMVRTLRALRQLLEAHTSSTSGEEGQGPGGSLRACLEGVSHVLGAAGERERVHAALVEARRDVAAQTSDPVQGTWLTFVRSLEGGVLEQPMQHRACCDTIVRIHLRGLNALEAREAAEDAARAARLQAAGHAAAAPSLTAPSPEPSDAEDGGHQPAAMAPALGGSSSISRRLPALNGSDTPADAAPSGAVTGSGGSAGAQGVAAGSLDEPSVFDACIAHYGVVYSSGDDQARTLAAPAAVWDPQVRVTGGAVGRWAVGCCLQPAQPGPPPPPLPVAHRAPPCPLTFR
jgi:hypothetical protein